MEPIVLRQLLQKDEDALFPLAKQAHIGLTSLPKNLSKLKKTISQSVYSFSKKTFCPSALYWFVLEDVKTCALLGTCGIHAQMEEGNSLSTFAFEEEKGHFLTKRPLLTTSKKIWPFSELCSLYLVPDARKRGLGKFLSYSRFLYIFLNQELFYKQIAARYRGYFTEDKKSPFWEYVGKAFANEEYELFLERSYQNPYLLEKFLPKLPIYLNLLPEKVRNICGSVHPNTEGAVKLLEKIGFKPTGNIDLFDAGPFYSASTADISLMQKIRSLPPSFSSKILEETLLVVVDKDPFTVVKCQGKICNLHICLPQELDKMLSLDSKQTVTAMRIN